MQGQDSTAGPFPWRAFFLSALVYLVLAGAYTWPLTIHLGTGLLNEIDAQDGYERDRQRSLPDEEKDKPRGR